MLIEYKNKERDPILFAAGKVSFFTAWQTNWLFKIKFHQSSWKQNIGQLKVVE